MSRHAEDVEHAQRWRLPEHAAEVLALFGWPHGADDSSGLWWSTRDDGTIRLFATCSDTFAWGTADIEPIEADDLPLLRECLADLRPFDEMYLLDVLFASRKRGMRPMRLWLYGSDHHKSVPVRALSLFEAAGPERDRASEG